MRIGVLASVGAMLDSFFVEIVAAWRASGHTVVLAAGTPTGGPDAATLIAGLGRRPGPSMLIARGGLRVWARDERLDVVVTNSATSSALVRAAGLPIPVVYFCHGLHWNTGHRVSERIWKAAESALLRRTDGVIAINGDDEKWFASHGLAPERLLRLPVGVGLDLEAYPSRRFEGPECGRISTQGPHSDRPSAGKLELAWIGEFSARKRPQAALEVASRLIADGIELRLTMLGEGADLDRVRERIGSLGLRGSVLAPGAGDAAEALAGSHALLHTASWEGLPRVMLEAIAVGRRTYAFDVKGVRDVPHADLAPDGDVAALSALIVADHRSGRLRDPASCDRAELDSTRTAETVLSFLERIVGIDRSAVIGRSTQ